MSNLPEKNIEPKKKKLSGVARLLSLSFLFIILIFGIFGSFINTKFNMDNYVKFLDKFIWPTSSLILSIGAGKITETLIQKKKNEEK